LNLENAGKTWTTEYRRQLREAFEEGKTLAQMQEIVGRTAGAVVGRLVQEGLLIQDRNNGFYYRVSPDPWCNHHDVRHIDHGG
jgi:hypothetical protein